MYMESNGKAYQTVGKEQERIYAVDSEELSKEYLVNKLNYINFQDKTILVTFMHTIYNTTLSLKAKPLPCMGDILECVWAHNGNHSLPISSYELVDILVPDGQQLLQVKSDRVSLDKKGFSFLLPDVSCDVSSRKAKRNFCRDIEVRLNQNSAVFRGQLIDFSSVSFRFEIETTPPQTFEWIDPKTPVNLQFSEGREIFYSGECRIIKQTNGLKTRSYVAEPLKHHVQRFKPKKYRNTRQEFIPSPNVIFRHPLTKKIGILKVIDIAGTGFSVEEEKDNAVLLPGMFIPELELNFANSYKAKCKAQVIYKVSVDETGNGNQLKCGLAFIDMSPDDHGKLLSLLYQSKDSNSYLSNQVNQDDLWRFFFKTGFIYPQKYEFFQENKNRIKNTYKKLYTEHPEIARHFIYQDQSRILGHMAILRLYQKSWLIHHHAADGKGSRKAGLRVLYQLGRFVNDSHELYSMQMNYAFCYYQPENRFPNHVFGGAAINIKDPKRCSLDTFAYFHINKQAVQKMTLTQPWNLMETVSQDLIDLKHFYEFDSGGLMLNALELDPESGDIDELATTYEKVGLKRERYLFSLKKEDRLKAVFMVDISDIGLNLSELTSSIKVLVVDPQGLPENALYQAFSGLCEKFESNEVPILLYPASYAENSTIPCEKNYNLWIMNLQYTDQYFSYIQRYFRGEKPC